MLKKFDFGCKVIKKLLQLVLTFLFINTISVYSYEKSNENCRYNKKQLDSSGFVLLTDIVPDAILDIRYYSTYNFMGCRISGYEEPVALITKEAATALSHVSDEVSKSGYRIKIFDAYRPQRACDHFVRWAKDLTDTRMKKVFYPDVSKSSLFDQLYLSAKSVHSRGSTVDLTLFDINAGKDVDMGSNFDYFNETSHPSYKGNLTKEQINNRQFLRNVMIKHGFRPLYTEWWHFILNGEPFPDTYFDFPVSIKSIRK